MYRVPSRAGRFGKSSSRPGRARGNQLRPNRYRPPKGVCVGGGGGGGEVCSYFVQDIRDAAGTTAQADSKSVKGHRDTKTLRHETNSSFPSQHRLCPPRPTPSFVCCCCFQDPRSPLKSEVWGSPHPSTPGWNSMEFWKRRTPAAAGSRRGGGLGL